MTVRSYAGGIAVAVTVTACLLFASHGAAQDKDTVWTTVAAQGANVSLTWNKSHPWDMELGAGGAQLIARYRADVRNDTSEVIGVAKAGGRNQRTIQFVLPQDLRGRPLGPVCLFIQLPNRKVLPVRRANSQNADTAGFRYEPWEKQIRQRGDLRVAQGRAAQADRALAVSTQNVANQQATVAKRGWGNLDSCNAITASRTDTSVQPYDVVSPSAQDDVARRVCVFRVWSWRKDNEWYIANQLPGEVKQFAAAQERSEAVDLIRGMYWNASFLPDIAPVLDELIRASGSERGTLATRGTQAAEFRRDWERLSPQMEGYQPHFGSTDDGLGLPTTARGAAFRVFGPAVAKRINGEWAMEGVPPATDVDKAGAIGVALDVYSGCLEDGRKQLKLKYDNWEALKSSAPQRAAAAQDFFVRECRQGVTLLDKLKAESVTMQEQLTREQQALRTLSSIEATLPTKPQALNLVSCSQQP